MDKNHLKIFVHNLLSSVPWSEFQPLSDKELLQRYIKHRDELAFREVVRRHGAMVWTVCRKVLRPRRGAADAYQAVFLKLAATATFVQRRGSVESWLHAVARNLAINAKQKCNRQRASDERREKMREDGYSNPRDTGDLAAILDEEVDYLPEKFRRPIILCYLEGLTPEQAARRIKISPHCLKRRLVNGQQRLHKRLSKRGINLDASMLLARLTSCLHSQQVPPGLMEKTLDMVRILTQSNDALEAEPVAGGTIMLARHTLEAWTLKAKLLLALLLTTLVLAGGGVIVYSAWLGFREEHPQEGRPGPTEKARESLETLKTRLQLTDGDGDLSRSPALGRLGIGPFSLDNISSMDHQI